MKKISHFIIGASLTLAASIAMASSSAATNAVQQEMVRYDNVQIEVNSQGKGPIIVMLPSLGRSGRDYDQVANYLQQDGFRVVRPEPRGIGQSKGPMEKLSVHDFARDIAAVVEHEKQGPVVVVGHAWGNFPARQLAADRPDLVRGVVLAAASAGKVPPGSTEKPINAEMRQAIDGAGDMSCPKSNVWSTCAKHSSPPATTPVYGLADGTTKRMKHSPMHAIPHRSMTTSPLARPQSWTCRVNPTQ